MQIQSSQETPAKNFSWFGWCIFLVIGILIGRGLNFRSDQVGPDKVTESKPISNSDREAFLEWQQNRDLHEQLKDELKKIRDNIVEQNALAQELDKSNNRFRSELENVRNETQTLQDEISFLVKNKGEIEKELNDLSQNLEQMNQELRQKELERIDQDNLEPNNPN